MNTPHKEHGCEDCPHKVYRDTPTREEKEWRVSEKMQDEIDKIRYEIEDFFDNGERRGDKYEYKDHKILAEKVEKMIKFLLHSQATQIQESFTKILPLYWYEYGIEGKEIDLTKLTPKQMFDIVAKSAVRNYKNTQ